MRPMLRRCGTPRITSWRSRVGQRAPPLTFDVHCDRATTRCVAAGDGGDMTAATLTFVETGGVRVGMLGCPQGKHQPSWPRWAGAHPPAEVAALAGPAAAGRSVWK